MTRTVKKWRVFYNTHRYSDCSDTARACSRIIEASTAEEARELVRDLVQVGWSNPRYIGMIHHAEPHPSIPTSTLTKEATK